MFDGKVALVQDFPKDEVIRQADKHAIRPQACRNRTLVFTLCVAAGLCFGLRGALAQPVGGGAVNPFGFQALIPSAPQSPANVAPPNGPLPPTGSGNSPQPVTAGDNQGSWQPTPSGTAQVTPINGTNFPTRTGQAAGTTSDIMDIPAERQTQGTPQPQPSGPHVVLTMPGAGGTSSIDEGGLEAMQDQIAPPPPYSTVNGRKTIDLDIVTSPKLPNSRPFLFPPGSNNVRLYGPTTTVRPFARFLVKLGVVFATVLMAFAAFSVVLGHKDAGKRVVSTAGGLILLLMGYTIYKIVILDTQLYGASNFAPADQNNQKPQNPSVPYAANTTPQVTNPNPAGGGLTRSNQPAAPFASELINQTQ